MAHSSRNKLAKWPLQMLVAVQRQFSEQLKEYEAVGNRINIPGRPDIDYTDHDNCVILRFWQDVDRLLKATEVVEAEMVRRVTLVGWM